MDAQVERVRLICDTCHRTIYNSRKRDDMALMRHRQAMMAAATQHRQAQPATGHELRVKLDAVA